MEMQRLQMPSTTTIKTTPISIWMKLFNTLAKIDYAIWTSGDGDPTLAAPTETGSITTDIPTLNQDLYYPLFGQQFYYYKQDIRPLDIESENYW